jgi:solute carrier family 6 amino acid transporter-like protein 5/7/9/14
MYILSDGKVTTAGDEETGPERQRWARGKEFLLSSIAMSFGLGKIWRFPFIVYNNGGAAFLIPYVVVHLLIGKPIYLLEVCIGQFMSRGPVKVWAISPALQGKLTTGNV